MFFTSKLTSEQKKTRQEAKLIHEALRRNRTEQSDLLSKDKLEKANAWEKSYSELLAGKVAQKTDETGALTSDPYASLAKLNEEVMKENGKVFTPNPHPEISENVEVFVVAAIMALAIRTFFLQPFVIPTGSMEPTLSGIEPVRLADDVLPPNFVYRVYQQVIEGKSYERIITKQGGEVSQMTEGTFTMWFPYTVVTLKDKQGHTEDNTIWIRKQDVNFKLHIFGPADMGSVSSFQPGAVLTNFAAQAGDVVAVDKVTYNFRRPERGDVIIFKTHGIDYPPQPLDAGMVPGNSPDFIKRCVGLPGDTIRIMPPLLYINDHLDSGSPVFDKQFKMEAPYGGYQTRDLYPTQTFMVPPHHYWAMGDNSGNSLDSRYWGGVPEQNIAGKGLFVLWPFTSRWGFIR